MIQLVAIIFMGILLCQGSADEQCAKDGKTVTKSQMQKLKERLLCGYDRTVRPVLHHGTETPVHVTMLLKSIHFQDSSSSLDIYAWMVWEWTDEHLQWSPADYDGLNKIHFDSDEIWVPQVSQFVSTESWESNVRIGSGRCEVQPSGSVICVPSVTYYCLCAADIRRWPYDTHNCTLKLAAWMQLGQEINLTGNEVDMHMYKPNRYWRLLAVEKRLHVESYSNNVTFPWLNYSFLLERHSGMNFAITGVPALLFTILVLCSFWLNPTEGSRIYLGCVNIICICLYLQYLSWMVSANAENCPLVVLFYRDSLIMSGMSVVATVIVRCTMTTASSPPEWVPSITNWVLSMRPGQLLLFGELSAKDVAAADEGSGEEGAGLVTSNPEPSGKAWQLFAVFLDRVFFLIFSLVYFILLLGCFT